VQSELKKALTGNKNYTTFKPIWAILIVVSVGLFFFFTKEYYKGLSLGLMILFIVFVIIDSLLHNRLKLYLNAIQEFTK